MQHWMALAYVLAGRRAEVERLAATHDHPFRLAVIHAALGTKIARSRRWTGRLSACRNVWGSC